MTERVLADAVVVLHALFVVFALLGGALVLFRPALAFLHLPAAAWAAWVEFTGTICPLTPLENQWRSGAGAAGYDGGFVEHYLMPALYPEGLTPRMQVAFGLVVVVINVAIYGFAWWRAHGHRATITSHQRTSVRKMSALESELRDNPDRPR
jgi:hypothetical protein